MYQIKIRDSILYDVVILIKVSKEFLSFINNRYNRRYQNPLKSV